MKWIGWRSFLALIVLVRATDSFSVSRRSAPSSVPDKSIGGLFGRPVRHAEKFSPRLAPLFASSVSRRSSTTESFLLQDFKTASGEIINPYLILKVPRTANAEEIKDAYRNLSRRYHPDGMRQHREILPGGCNTVQEVREHWDRILLSYEILSNPKRRLRYDRNEALDGALADPSTAVQKVAFSALVALTKGLWTLFTFAVKQFAKSSTPGTSSSPPQKTNPSSEMDEIEEAFKIVLDQAGEALGATMAAAADKFKEMTYNTLKLSTTAWRTAVQAAEESSRAINDYYKSNHDNSNNYYLHHDYTPTFPWGKGWFY